MKRLLKKILGRKTVRTRTRAKPASLGQIELLENRELLSATVYGDFNGDRIDDVAIGLPYEDVGSIEDAGIVRIMYGSREKGLQAFGDQVWHQNSPGTKEDAEAGDHFGAALAAGDFNGDGVDDLAVGVPGEDLQSTDLLGFRCIPLDYNDAEAQLQIAGCNAGAVHVLYGSREKGLQAFGDQIWHQNSEGINDKETAETFDLFGSVLAAGDFNGDGTDDLAIGVPNEAVDRDPCTILPGLIPPCMPLSEGVVQVLYGSQELGLQSFGDQIWHQNSEGINDKERVEVGDGFGGELAVGDFNGDGRDDLAIGVPGERLEGDTPDTSIANAGVVQVLYGSQEKGLQSFGDQIWHQNSEGINDKETAENGDEFGERMVAGDFNGDGRDDLAVGVFRESIGDVPFAGVVQVLYGSQELGLQSFGDQIWHQNSEGISEKETAEAYDEFGLALAARDFNGDGCEDLAVGVPREDIGAIVNAGVVQILYGSRDAGLQSFGDQIWHQSMEQVTGEEIKDDAETEDLFGDELAAGDFNGDGRADLAVRIPGEQVEQPGDGLVSVIYGSQAKGLQSFGDQLWWQTAEGLKEIVDDGDSAPISPPIAPEPLSARTVSSTQVQLSWTNVAGESGYRVYFWNGTAWQLLGTVTADVTTYPVSNLSPGTRYYFRVAAFNSAGVNYTTYIEATTLADATVAPVAPDPLTWQQVSSTQGQLSWSDVAGEDGYRLYYWDGSNRRWVEFASVAANVTTASVTVSPNSRYYFTVGAFNSVGAQYTNYIDVTTPTDNQAHHRHKHRLPNSQRVPRRFVV